MIAPRYRLRAYVCKGGVVHEQVDEGYALVADIFARRPTGCKYAIVEQPDGMFLCIDLFDLHWEDKAHSQMGLGNHRLMPTYDSAIMATAMTYFIVSHPNKH